jgi:hypothetical protein
MHLRQKSIPVVAGCACFYKYLLDGIVIPSVKILASILEWLGDEVIGSAAVRTGTSTAGESYRYADHSG